MYTAIHYEKNNQVGVIRFDRPKQLNAMNRTMRDEMFQCLRDVENDQDVRVLILWGGEMLFGAGADVTDFSGSQEGNPSVSAAYQSEQFQEVCNTIERLAIPTIAAIGGHCLGMHLEMALACDIRIVSKNVKIGLPELRLGVLPGAGGTQRLPRIIGASQAKEILFSAGRMNSEEAYRLGLANHVAEEGTLLETAMQLASKIAANAPLAVRQAKQLVNASTNHGLSEGLALERTANGMLGGSEDQIEGARAFQEKRAPEFKGR